MKNRNLRFIFDFHKKIIKLADDFNMLTGCDLVIIAVSGGADSMCLLNALLDISKKRVFNVVAAHFNHKLRGAESERDEVFVANECKMRNVRLITGSADVNLYSDSKGIGIEEAARDLRYEFLSGIKKELHLSAGSDSIRIATAHNADDLAETIILNLTRGTGACGLSGIPPVRDEIIRPMLHISRVEIMEYINIRDIKYIEDSTNSITDFTRNKIRHLILPVLKEINPRFIESVVKTSEMIRIDEEHLMNLAEKYLSSQESYKDSGFLYIDSLHSLPEPVRSRVFKIIGDNRFSYKHINAIQNLCSDGSPSRFIMLPRMIVRRKSDKIYFLKEI